MNNKKLIPARPIPPGLILRQELDARGWTQKQFSEIIDLSEKAISAIVNGRKQVTPEAAIKFAAAFDTSAVFWMNLEANYRLYRAMKESNEKQIAAIRSRGEALDIPLDEEDEEYEEEEEAPEQSTDESPSSQLAPQSLSDNPAIFGEIPEEVRQRLRQEAEKQGVSLFDLVQNALTQALSPPIGPSWPRLSDAAYRALVGAGLDVEAQSVNEDYFARWLEYDLAQAQASLKQGYVREGLSILTRCRHAISLPAQVSPLVVVLRQLLEMLEDATQLSARVQRGNISHHDLEQLINSEVAERTSQEKIDSLFFQEPVASRHPF